MATFEKVCEMYTELRRLWGSTETTFSELERAYINTMAAAVTCPDDRVQTLIGAIATEYEMRAPYFMGAEVQKPVVSISIAKFPHGRHFYVRARNRAAGIDYQDKRNTPSEAQKLMKSMASKYRRLGMQIEFVDDYRF